MALGTPLIPPRCLWGLSLPGMRARAPESARTNVHLTEQYGRPCFSFSIYKVGIRSHNCGTMSMEHLAQCLAMRNPEHRKVISSGHSSGSFHIPIRKAAEPRCARMTFGFRLGTPFGGVRENMKGGRGTQVCGRRGKGTLCRPWWGCKMKGPVCPCAVDVSFVCVCIARVSCVYQHMCLMCVVLSCV